MLVEATAVEARGRITPGCLGLWDDATEAALGGRTGNPGVFGRHARHPARARGRKGSSHEPWNGGTLILPATAGGSRSLRPRSRSPQTSRRRARSAAKSFRPSSTRSSTRRAALRAWASTLSSCTPRTAISCINSSRRSPTGADDEYGGSLESRMRFPLEVFAAVRAVWPEDRPLGVRLSATDWVDGGWTIDDTIVFARALKALGCDWIDCSSGGVSPQQKIPLGPGIRLHSPSVCARKSRRDDGGRLVTEPQQAEAIIASGRPTWSRLRAGCSGTRAGRGTRRRHSAQKSMRRSNTGVRRTRHRGRVRKDHTGSALNRTDASDQGPMAAMVFTRKVLGALACDLDHRRRDYPGARVDAESCRRAFNA